MADRAPEDIYRTGILDAHLTMDLLPEDNAPESNAGEPEYQESLLAILDYREAFKREVMQPFRDFEEASRGASLGEHLADRNVTVLRLTRPDEPARLIPDAQFGFGINLPPDIPAATSHRLTTLLNTTFFYGEDCMTRLPQSKVEYLVFSDGQHMSRRDWEALWCRAQGETLLRHERAVMDMRGLFADFGKLDTVFVRPDGVLYAP